MIEFEYGLDDLCDSLRELDKLEKEMADFENAEVTKAAKFKLIATGNLIRNAINGDHFEMSAGGPISRPFTEWIDLHALHHSTNIEEGTLIFEKDRAQINALALSINQRLATMKHNVLNEIDQAIQDITPILTEKAALTIDATNEIERTRQDIRGRTDVAGQWALEVLWNYLKLDPKKKPEYGLIPCSNDIPCWQGIYLLWDGDELDYIGQSQNISVRLKQHHIYKEDTHSVFVIPIENRKYRLLLEKLLIKTLQPVKNVVMYMSMPA